MVKIITLNINGLKTNARENHLNNFIQRHTPDILALQETNVNELPLLINSYECIINNNIENKKSGTIIIYKKSLDIQSHEKSPDGRIIRAVFENLTIVNLYAPTQKETAQTRHHFFLNRVPSYIKPNDTNLFLLGDFNSVINPLDRSGTFKQINKNLKNLIKSAKLIDCFRFVHPSEINYTFVCPNGKSRIDHIYMESTNRNRIISCTHEIYAFSDHSAVILTIDENVTPRKRKNYETWKLNTSHLQDETFKEHSSILLNQAKTKKHLYPNLLEWWEFEVKKKFKKMSITYGIQKTQTKNRMKNFYLKCLDRAKKEIDNGLDVFHEYHDFKQKIKNILEEEERGKKVRGRLDTNIDSEITGVANLIKERKRGEEKQIRKMNDANQEPKIDPREIRNIINNFYQNLYTLSPHENEARNEVLQLINPVITKEQNEIINEKIYEFETWAAISSLQKNKSPGEDGLPIEFYQTFWPEIKKEFTEVLNFIISNKNMSKSQRTGTITLIHKGGTKSNIGNWRPISLLCTDYKILAKIVTLRLKEVLPGITSTEQTGGIKDRRITQNLNTIRNLIEHYSNQKTQKDDLMHPANNQPKPRGAAIVSLDFEKAYDKVDRGFLYRVLERFGFSENFIDIIRTLYENAEAKILINGEKGEAVHLERGVRQGCPLAMYLYIIFLEPFLQLLKTKITDVKIANSKYLLTAFVDDVTVFIQNYEDFSLLESCISQFEKATNSKVNKAKTQTLSLGTWTTRTVWPHEWIKPQHEIKLLGVYWSSDILTTTTKNCTEILRKTTQALNNTFNRSLTIH